LVVGLTGGICSGKSTVATMFRELGAVVIDADRITHELQEPGQPLVEEIAAAFGRQVVGEDGGVDRTKLGPIVFSDPDARSRLEAILHPAIIAESRRRIRDAAASGASVCILDAALLIESGRHERFDRIVLVEASEDAQLRRLMARTGIGADEAARRIRSQMPLEEKRRRAHFRIDNDGPLEETARQVRAVWERLLALHSSKKS
jgi:dephospho-CoA kinase